MAAKFKEDIHVQGCNAAIQVKHLVLNVRWNLRSILQHSQTWWLFKSWQQPCFDGTKWGWNFTLALFASSCPGCVVYCRHRILQLDMVPIKYAQAVYLCWWKHWLSSCKIFLPLACILLSSSCKSFIDD
jgi:hypothetical protein